MRVVVTGCGGLIGSAFSKLANNLGWEIIGIDNNYRERLLGLEGSVASNLSFLKKHISTFAHYNTDIRDKDLISKIWREARPDAVIHCAAQTSHELAAKIPYEDFEINAVGTLNLLEATRQYAPNAPFIYLSTNKVYGDNPNHVPLVELPTRWDFKDNNNYQGFDENCSIDSSTHSLFGASKLAGDILVQEYGRYFGLATTSLRLSCVTGPYQSGVQLQGFLNYLIKCCVFDRHYSVFGYRGKQVRDQIHADDVAKCIALCIQHPRQGAIYNIGGGRNNSASVLECIDLVERATGRTLSTTYIEQHRIGDHICYISDTRKFREDFPQWKCEYSLDEIILEMVGVLSQVLHFKSHN